MGHVFQDLEGGCIADMHGHAGLSHSMITCVEVYHQSAIYNRMLETLEVPVAFANCCSA
jgi:hypothetical protein